MFPNRTMQKSWTNSALGCAFLMRNYRSDPGKWQTSDPLGYPDGWNNFAYCNNSVIYSFDYAGFGTVQIGLTFFGGGGVGGISSFGIAIGYSKDAGFTAGFYQTAGGGANVGAGGSVSDTVTVSGAGAISALAGTAMTIGGSGGEGLVIGGDANIPTNIAAMGNTSFDFSIGFGAGTPAEQHTLITETFIQQIVGNGGRLYNGEE